MRLAKLVLENYRCYKEPTPFVVDDLTAIIGKNDIGKSAILDAIDAFFNDVIDKSDLSIDANNPKIQITCFFEGLPDEIVLDSSVLTSPQDEGILNCACQLQVRKTYTFGARKSVSIHLIADQPEDQRLEKLLSLKNASLKALAENLGVNLDDVDKRKNPPIRERIRNHIGGGRVEEELKVDGGLTSEDNLKAIWTSLKKLLPIFSLFKNDKSFDDKDGDIKNPMQVAIDEALALDEIQGLLAQVESRVKEFSTDVADRTIAKLQNFDESLSENLKSDFGKDPNYGKVFDLTLLNERNIPLNKRGSGIRRLVVLSFFQAQAERRKAEKDAPSIIYAIEEPETSQHPNHQKMIIDSLIELGAEDCVQVMFTTHNANFAREIPLEARRYISANETGTIHIESGKTDNEENPDVVDKIVKALGILPNPSDCIKVLLYVEGNHDVNALKRYSEILSREDPTLPNLKDLDAIGYVITGGSALKHYIEQKHLDGLGKPQVHIYDNDVADYRTAVQGINDLNDPTKVAFNTRKLELESYLHHVPIEAAYASNGTLGVAIGTVEDEMDVPIEVAKKMNALTNDNWDTLSAEKKKDLASAKKKLLNTNAVEHMTVEQLREREGFDEMKLWFESIGQFI